MREAVVKVAKLTDMERKKIIADRADGQSIRQLAKSYAVSTTTIQKVLKRDPEMTQMIAQKKEQNTADILAYMESKRDQVCNILQTGLDVLPEKIRNAKSASEVTTAIGTLIDKWALISGGPENTAKEDELSRSLRELGENLESDET